MPLGKTLRLLRREVGASSLFPITHLNAPTIFETQTGAIGATLKLKGIPFTTELNETLNQYSHLLHQTLGSFDSAWLLYLTLHRKKADIHLQGQFTSAFAETLDRQYHQRFQGQNNYHNTYYLTLLLKPPVIQTAWLTRLMGKSLTSYYASRRTQQMALLAERCQKLVPLLQAYQPVLLGSQDHLCGHSELLTFLSLIPNAGRGLTFNTPHASSLDKNTQDNPNTASYPSGRLGEYLCNTQLLFGKELQFEGVSARDRRFAILLSVKKYPQGTGSILLDPLLEVDSEFISTQTFRPVSKDDGLEKIRIQRGKLMNTEDKALSQLAALTDLEDAIASEQASLGYHHHSLMLLCETQEALEEALPTLHKALSDAGMGLVKETLGAEPLFWAQIPGNEHLIARRALITSKNLCDFWSMHNYARGHHDANHLGSAVTLLETRSKTPVYFNYHATGSKDNPAKGHAAIFGSNDAGKTTLAAFLDAQMNRYGSRSFFLDRNEGLKIYVLASGNSTYHVISPKSQNTLALNPFQLPDTPENRTFLKTWFKQLLLKPQETDLPAAIAGTVNECIDYSYEQLAAPYRQLSTISRFLPIDFPRWDELKQWLRANETHGQGEYAWLFDNACDALNMAFDKVGFDVTYLMDEVTAQVSTPVYLYLVHRMRQSLDGRLTTFLFDEFHQILRSPFWVNYLKDWLPTIRKLNGHFVFMTQSPQQVVDSPVAPTVLDNVATLIFFPNPKADKKTYQGMFNLSTAEYQILKENVPQSRLFLYKQGNESLLCQLDLSNMPAALRVFSGNTHSVRLLESLMETHGRDPKHWLRHFLQRSGA